MSEKKIVLSAEQVEFFTNLLKTHSISQIGTAVHEFDRGRTYRADRGKAERLSSKLLRTGQLTDDDARAIQDKGLVAWYRNRR